MQLAPTALKALCTLSFAGQRTLSFADDGVFADHGGEIEEDTSLRIVKRQSQRERKNAKRKRAATVDRAPFEKLGLWVPESKWEADSIEQSLLKEQQETFQASDSLVYLTIC